MVDIIVGLARYLYLAFLWLFVIIIIFNLKSQITIKSKKNKLSNVDKKYVLQVVEGSQINKSLPLDNRDITVGRSGDNDIVLKDDFVSAKHLKVYRDGKKIYLEDLSSTNGTFIKGKRVYGINEIKIGQLFTLGTNGLEVRMG
ncbi:MAG: FHA domain-containing protein [Bifidobacteriaceae bacterium]|nr:FHA domain-containing protein [Bifidobacteriaceae bacterium]